jgi:hypothetical protein
LLSCKSMMYILHKPPKASHQLSKFCTWLILWISYMRKNW